MIPKIIFFDLDGTLSSNADHSIPFYERIPQSTKDALNTLHNNGILTALATGRSHANISNLKAQLPMDTFVLSNGACVIHHDELIMSTAMPHELVVETIHTLESIPGINVVIETADTDYIINEKRSDISYIGSNLPVIPIDQVNQHKVFQVIGNGFEISNKVTTINPLLSLKKFGDHAFDISLKSIHKGDAIREVLSILNIEPSQAMAFGDGENDIEMFNVINTTIAMGESDPTLRQIATYITDTVENDGIAKALQHFNLI